jgi:hypothetical protein
LSLRILKSRGGQATTEYILLMVLVVVMGLGALYRLNDAFRVFATNYFGSYLACLIETGELPMQEGGECENSYRPFSLADGRPKVTGDGGASGGGGTDVPGGGNNSGSGDDSGTGSDGDGLDNDGTDDSADSGGGGGGGSPATFGDGFGDSVDGSGRSSSVGLSNADGKGGDNGRPKTVSALTGGGIEEQTIYDDSAGGRQAYVPMSGLEREDQRRVNGQKGDVPVNEADMRGGGRTVAVSADEKKLKQAMETDTGLNLPDFLRWLIIAGIVIAIVFFMGGQFLQISKSQEK